MEIVQYLMHLGRSFELYDILANSIGTLIGVSIYIILAKMNKEIYFNKAENTLL